MKAWKQGKTVSLALPKGKLTKIYEDLCMSFHNSRRNKTTATSMYGSWCQQQLRRVYRFVVLNSLSSERIQLWQAPRGKQVTVSPHPYCLKLLFLAARLITYKSQAGGRRWKFMVMSGCGYFLERVHTSADPACTQKKVSVEKLRSFIFGHLALSPSLIAGELKLSVTPVHKCSLV